FRIPIESAGQTANLLVPLYGVIAAGSLAQMPGRFRDRPAPGARRPALARDGLPPGTRDRSLGALGAVLLGFVVLYALQGVYADDVTFAAQQVVFFYVPFALLFGTLRPLAGAHTGVVRC